MLLAKLALLSATLASLSEAGPLQALTAALTPRQSPSFKNTNGIVSALSCHPNNLVLLLIII
jgi:hypothetical protein